MKTTPEVQAAIQQALDKAGGQRQLALALGVTQQAVSAWLNGDKWMPVKRARQVEELTGVPAASMVNPEKVL